MSFDVALRTVLHHEGGYVNHPADPGGETNYGITVRVARNFGYHGPMRDIPMDVVENIYRTLYWDKVNGDELPPHIAIMTFDFAVNSGVRRAAQYLQKAARVPQDGVIGPKTVAAILENQSDIAVQYLVSRIWFMMRLRHWKHFGKGWSKRIIELTWACGRLA